MQRIRVTSPYFTGSIDIVFDQYGQLCLFDAMQATLTDGQMKLFLKNAQSNVSTIEQWFGGTKAKLIEVPLEATFDMFWSLYAKKINKVRVVKLWEKLNDTDKMSAILGITKYNNYLSRETWRSKADPETYIRGKYWENEY